MDSDILETLGLSKAEGKAYSALISLGSSTTGRIIKESGIPSSHIYEVLKRLIDKGLATYFISNNTKYFQATPPEGLIALYKKKKEELLSREERIIEQARQFALIANLAKDEQDIKIYEGLQGIRSSIEKMLSTLKAGETYYVLGAPLIGNKKLNAFYRDVHARRVKQKIAFRIIYNRSAEAFAKEREKLPYTQVRIADIDAPTELCVFGEYAQIIIFSKKPILIEIKNREVAEGFLSYFNAIWEKARKI